MTLRRIVGTTCLVTLWLVAVPRGAPAQELILLEPEYASQIAEQVSGDAAYEHIRYISRFHRPRGGADGLWEVAEYIERRAEEYGLQDVRVIKQPYVFPPWNASFAELRINEPWVERVASTTQTPLHLADYSRPAAVTGELVDVGEGTAKDLEAVDLTGKVVLTFGDLATVMREAVGNRGALGVVWYPDPFMVPNALVPGSDAPDQIRWSRVSPVPTDGFEPTFAFILSLRQGLELRRKLERSDEPVRVRAKVDAEFDSRQGPDPWQVMVEAFIPGREPDLEQDIVLTGHIQEEGSSANDNASGSASILEIARALNHLIESGDLPRPRRDIRFWWTTENSSERQYFADHPESIERMWVNVNQDMVGADQSQDLLRKQNVSRLPAARFHLLNDVMEAVVEYVVAGNTMEIAQVQAGFEGYPRPHVASLGSRHRYNAEAVFFHVNTDHMTFLETPIGIPAIAFTNFPDRYIHSSDDDLWNVDRTQLGRNALAAALITYIMASADEGTLPPIAAEVVGRGAERLGRNLRLGLSWIQSAPDPDAAYHHALDQLNFAMEREVMAVRSLAEVHPAGQRYAEENLEYLRERASLFERELGGAFRRTAEQEEPPMRNLTAPERELSGLLPVIRGDAAEFNSGRTHLYSLIPADMHFLMAFEVLNAIDGERTGLEIFRYISAQAREGGAHYFGSVNAPDVLQYLHDVVDTGLVGLAAASSSGGDDL